MKRLHTLKGKHFVNDPHTYKVVGVIFQPLSQSPKWTLTTWNGKQVTHGFIEEGKKNTTKALLQ